MTTKRKTLGAEILDGLKEAIAFERGELRGVRTKRVSLTARDATAEPAPAYSRDGIAKLRERLGLSQPVFARALNVSPETVRAWEQGKRTPEGAALRLLQLADEHPQWLLRNVTDAGRGPASPRPARGTS